MSLADMLLKQHLLACGSRMLLAILMLRRLSQICIACGSNFFPILDLVILEKYINMLFQRSNTSTMTSFMQQVGVYIRQHVLSFLLAQGKTLLI